jgi:hypothetical protein
MSDHSSIVPFLEIDTGTIAVGAHSYASGSKHAIMSASAQSQSHVNAASYLHTVSPPNSAAGVMGHGNPTGSHADLGAIGCGVSIGAPRYCGYVRHGIGAGDESAPAPARSGDGSGAGTSDRAPKAQKLTYHYAASLTLFWTAPSPWAPQTDVWRPWSRAADWAALSVIEGNGELAATARELGVPTGALITRLRALGWDDDVCPLCQEPDADARSCRIVECPARDGDAS